MNIRPSLFSVLLVAVVVVCTVVFALAEVLVCPKCGYENLEGSWACDHCKADLPASKKVAEPSVGGPASTFLESGRLQFLGEAVVESEIQQGVDCVKTGNLYLARSFFRNASALETLSAPALTNGRSVRILELLRKADPGRGTGKTSCPMCEGSGKATIGFMDLKGQVSEREVSGKVCSRCGGTGQVSRPASMGERKFAVGQAASQYAAMQQARKCVPIGGAWLPVELEQKLSKRQVVMLRRAVPGPCVACLGSGRTDCVKCSGSGEVPCPGKCKQGMVTVAAAASLTKTTISRREKCPLCQGKGTVACKDCVGSGSVVCKTCNGTGELPACKKCGGQGYVECGKCTGTGSLKGTPCPSCGSEGITVCSSCSGDGRTSK